MTVTQALASSSGPTVSGLDLVNLFASAFSIVLAVVALALAIFFFVQSKNSADQSAKSADEISASVARLEKLFDSLYSDTFAMMRETVTDMRQHVWKVKPESSMIPNGAEAKIEAEREQSQAALLAELGRVSKRVGLTDAKISELTEQLTPVIKQALEEQERVVEQVTEERKQASLDDRILTFLRRRGPIAVFRLAQVLEEDRDDVMMALFNLAHQGVATWDTAPGAISTHDVVRYVPVRERGKKARATRSDAAGQTGEE